VANVADDHADMVRAAVAPALSLLRMPM
jgi:hypothetical protein